MIPCPNGTLPKWLDPIYMEGYIEGYKQAKKDILEALKKMEAYSEVSATATSGDNNA